MKSIINLNLIKLIISMLAIITAIFGIFSCSSKDDNGTDIQTEFKKKLASTWTITGGKAMKDDIDVTDAFTGLSIAFTADGKYTTTNPVSPIWPATGSFTVSGNNSLYILHRDDNVDVSVNKIDEHHLNLSLHYQTTNARSEEVSGEYFFNLTR